MTTEQIPGAESVWIRCRKGHMAVGANWMSSAWAHNRASKLQITSDQGSQFRVCEAEHGTYFVECHDHCNGDSSPTLLDGS